jgi:hypothetical protein
MKTPLQEKTRKADSGSERKRRVDVNKSESMRRY